VNLIDDQREWKYYRKGEQRIPATMSDDITRGGHHAVFTARVSSCSIETLKTLTGKNFGPNKTFWYEWWERVEGDIASGSFTIPDIFNKSEYDESNPYCIPCSSSREFIYADNDNYFFVFAPPKGWKQHGYRDIRTKVSFHDPQDERRFVRIITRDSDVTSFDELRAEVEKVASEMLDKGVETSDAEEYKFLGTKALSVTVDSPSIASTRILLCVVSGVHLNIQWASPSKTDLERHWPTVSSSIQTIVVLRDDTADAEAVRQHKIENVLHLAQIAVKQAADRETAKAILQRGMQLFPGNKDIRSALREL